MPIAAIAIASGLNDSDTFEFKFRDEDNIPFELAGAISSWGMELPDNEIGLTPEGGGDGASSAGSRSAVRSEKAARRAPRV